MIDLGTPTCIEWGWGQRHVGEEGFSATMTDRPTWIWQQDICSINSSGVMVYYRMSVYGSTKYHRAVYVVQGTVIVL